MVKDEKVGKVKKDRFKGIRQIVDVVKMTNELSPKFKVYSAVAVLVPLVVFATLSIVTAQYFIFVPLAVFGPILAFMVTLSRCAQSAGYNKVDGQPGASGAVLNQIKFASTSFDEQPVAVDPKTYDLIFRGVGRAGVFLVSEGPTSRVKKMVDKEVQRTKRVLQNVPIHVINYGNLEGQVPLKKLRSVIAKKKIVLTKDELKQVQGRLNALGTMKMPIPKGMDPNRMPKGMNRRALRGK
ncbi:MAG: DUF4191 domain-containing protein [Candidatus Ancillula sp.]|nr:DUF4191 domain-containing protein [Candidatus Ancillula sp.]